MNISDAIDFDAMTLDKFKTWTPQALKTFLHIRSKSTEGSYDELAARAFVVYEENIDIDVIKEALERKNLKEYKDKLHLGNDVTLPDPYDIRTGWLNEEAMNFWPTINFCDISNYLKLKTPTELHDRLINEYKEGKAYRYYASGWVKEIMFHNIDDHSDFCIMATKVTPSMRLRMPPYEVWAIVEKKNCYT